MAVVRCCCWLEWCSPFIRCHSCVAIHSLPQRCRCLPLRSGRRAFLGLDRSSPKPAGRLGVCMIDWLVTISCCRVAPISRHAMLPHTFETRTKVTWHRSPAKTFHRANSHQRSSDVLQQVGFIPWHGHLRPWVFLVSARHLRHSRLCGPRLRRLLNSGDQLLSQATSISKL